MEAFPIFKILIFGLVVGTIPSLLTRMTILSVVLCAVAVTFLLSLAVVFSVELAGITAFSTALPILAGALVGKNIRKRWEN